jgi:hypothetical protein
MSHFFKHAGLLALVGFAACGEQTGLEKVTVVKNDVVRGAQEAAHRVQEAVCLKGDLECFARKAKNRTTEAANAVSDTASEIKDKVDGR